MYWPSLRIFIFWWETVQRVNPSGSWWCITHWWDEPIVPTAEEQLPTGERLRVCLSTKSSPGKVEKCLLILSPHVRAAALSHTLTCWSPNMENNGKQANAPGSSQPDFNPAHTFLITLDDAYIFKNFNELLKTRVRTLTPAVISSYLLIFPSKPLLSFKTVQLHVPAKYQIMLYPGQNVFHLLLQLYLANYRQITACRPLSTTHATFL